MAPQIRQYNGRGVNATGWYGLADDLVAVSGPVVRCCMKNDSRIIDETDCCVTYRAAGPWHEFLLLRYDQAELHHWSYAMDIVRSARKDGNTDVFAELSDDAHGYIFDQVCWIDSINPRADPTLNIPTKGLCVYGFTVITGTGAETASAVFGGWAALFASGPDPLILRGPGQSISDEEGNSVPGTYKSTCYVYSKASLITNLRKIAAFAEQVKAAPTTYFIMHLGI
jgi:hypothetical protein